MNRQEKEKLVIELYKQGKTIRQIAQIAHMSFGDISCIIRQASAETEEQERSRISKASQALNLFEQGNTPVQVAIKLDIETQEVDRLYKEYWNLKGLYNHRQVYAELKGNVSAFLKLYQLTKNEGMGPQQVVNALKIAEKLPRLEAEYDYVRGHVFTLKGQQGKLERDLYELNKYKEISANHLESLRGHAEKLRRLIDRLKNTEEYLKINEVVQKKVREILDNKRLIIGIALSALLMAIRNEPDKRLVNDLLYETNAANPPNRYYSEKLLELGQICYDQLVRDSINRILDSTPLPYDP